jgi:hypothetical protein
MADMISPTDYEISSQFAHFFTAAFLVSQFGLFGGLKWLIISSFAMFGFAVYKEFVYDLKHENPLVRGSSPRDFTLYTGGIALADVLFFIARHFVK